MPSYKEPLTGGQILVLCASAGIVLLALRLALRDPDPSISQQSLARSSAPTTNLRTLRLPTGGDVVLFQSKQAARDALAIINAGGALGNLYRYISCVVPSNTPAVRLDVSFSGLSEVIVDSGPQVGCRGWVPMEFVK